MGSLQYSVSDSTTSLGNIEYRRVNDIYYCHNCGVKDVALRSVSLFGLNFYLCDGCFKEFQKYQQQHSCPALNPDWYE